MNLPRAIVSVIAGIGLMTMVVQVMENMLVTSFAAQPVTTIGEYFAARNTPGLMAAMIGITAMAGILGGYTCARIARGEEIRMALLAALIQSVVLAWDYTTGEYAWGTPVWMRITLCLISGPAMLTGASIRARAAALEPDIPPPADTDTPTEDPS